MNLSLQESGTCLSSFLGGYAEDMEVDDGFQTDKRADFKVTSLTIVFKDDG